MRPITLLGFPNVIAESDSLISQPLTAPAGFEEEYLQTEEPSDTARIPTIDPLYSMWSCDFQSSFKDVYGLATINSNISPWGYYRYFSSSGGGLYTVLNTTSIATSNNRTGNVTDVDEAILTPDSLYMSPTTTTSDWSVRLNFSTPGSSPITGTARGLIVLNVILVGTPLVKYPRVSVDLYQSNVFLQSLGYRAVTRSSGSQTFIFDFDPVVLSNSNGSSMSALISFQPGSNTSYGKLDTARCYVITATAEKDSNFINSPSYLNPSRESITKRSTSFHYFPVSPWLDITNVYFQIVDDQVDHSPDMGNSVSGIPINNVKSPESQLYTQAGVWVAGGTLEFNPGLTPKEPGSVGIAIQGVSGNTLGGQSYGANTWIRRKTGPLTIYCTRAEADLFMEHVPWLKGNSGAFYLSMDPDIDQQHQKFQSFWATLLGGVERPEIPSFYDSGSDSLYSLKCEFQEKL